MNARLRRLEWALSSQGGQSQVFCVEEDHQGRWWVWDPQSRSDRLLSQKERGQLEDQDGLLVICRDAEGRGL